MSTRGRWGVLRSGLCRRRELLWRARRMARVRPLRKGVAIALLRRHDVRRLLARIASASLSRQFPCPSRVLSRARGGVWSCSLVAVLPRRCSLGAGTLVQGPCGMSSCSHMSRCGQGLCGGGQAPFMSVIAPCDRLCDDCGVRTWYGSLSRGRAGAAHICLGDTCVQCRALGMLCYVYTTGSVMVVMMLIPQAPHPSRRDAHTVLV